MTDNRTNGLIVAKALVAHCEDHKIPFPRGSVKKIVEALRVAGRLAGEPTETQVEAAAQALYDLEDSQAMGPGWVAETQTIRAGYRRMARSVLSAAGVAPQEPSKEIHEPDTNRIYCVRCGYDWPCQPSPSPAREKLAQREAEEYAPGDHEAQDDFLTGWRTADQNPALLDPEKVAEVLKEWGTEPEPMRTDIARYRARTLCEAAKRGELT